MAILRLLLLVAFLAAGLVVGSLNRQRIVLDDEVVRCVGVVRLQRPYAGVVAVVDLIPHHRNLTVQSCEQVGNEVGAVRVGHHGRRQAGRHFCLSTP